MGLRGSWVRGNGEGEKRPREGCLTESSLLREKMTRAQEEEEERGGGGEGIFVISQIGESQVCREEDP